MRVIRIFRDDIKLNYCVYKLKILLKRKICFPSQTSICEFNFIWRRLHSEDVRVCGETQAIKQISIRTVHFKYMYRII